MKKREKSPYQVEFSEERVKLVNDGCQQQRHTYQLQNRGPGSVRVRAAIGADSDPVSRPSPRLHKHGLQAKSCLHIYQLRLWLAARNLHAFPKSLWLLRLESPS